MVEIVIDKSITGRLKEMGLEPEWLNGGSLRKLDNGGDDAFVQFENRKSGPYTYDCSLKMGDEIEALRMDFSLRTLDNRKQILEVKKIEVFNETLGEVTHTADLSANHHVNRGIAENMFKAFDSFSRQRGHSAIGYAFQAADLSKNFGMEDAFTHMNSPTFKSMDEEPRARLHGNRLQADAIARKTIARPGG